MNEVSYAASLGLITTAGPDGSITNRWTITQAGLEIIRKGKLWLDLTCDGRNSLPLVTVDNEGVFRTLGFGK